MARLFVAVWPPEDVVTELMSLRRKDQRGVRFVPPENWHLTLRFLGEADPDVVADALDGGEYPAATARLGPGVDVRFDRALVVPATGIEALAAAVTSRTASLGEPPPKRFVGHLTLARLKANAAMPPALGAYVSVEFDVAEIALVHSRLGPAGARYETIGAWPVGTAASAGAPTT
jgi:RNA 2',3'-cyclic 3'-phosphodiesterase